MRAVQGESEGVLRAAWRAFREPVPEEKRRLLAERWRDLDPRWRRSGQGFGRQATGCGATIGVMPRCDFACRGCYLGHDANAVPPLPLDAVLAQLEELRSWLGPKGNLQLTDGEVTLRDPEELVAIIRRAREVGLTPMVMSHGDSFRRRPELLPRLVSEAGLTEVSIHVDSTQRGRRGYREAVTEAELMPLRDEMAETIRDVRRQTGVRLRAATTLTVTRDNLPEIADVMRWILANRDAFSIVSFQPLAQVGRTEEEMEGVSAEELWTEIGHALDPHGFDAAQRTPLHFGHPDCSRVEPLVVVEKAGNEPQLMPLVRPGEEGDLTWIEGYFDRGLGGLCFRDDPLPVRLSRTVGAFLSAPVWLLGPARRWVAARLRDAGVSVPGFFTGVATGRLRIDTLNVISHHFMSDDEVDTERGQERLAACVFRVPAEGEMIPMCQANAGGGRDRLYQIASDDVAAKSAREPLAIGA